MRSAVFPYPGCRSWLLIKQKIITATFLGRDYNQAPNREIHMGLLSTLFGKKKPGHLKEKCAICGKFGWFPNTEKGEYTLLMVDKSLVDSMLRRCPTCKVFLHQTCTDDVQEAAGTCSYCPICGKRM